MRWAFGIALLLLSLPAIAQGTRSGIGRAVPVVAAENFYGELAAHIGGQNVRVTSILSNPDQDPHLFEVSPSVARDLSAAGIVIYNGADYDPWVAKLLAASSSTDRQIIVVADLVHKKTGDNPHLWYDPQTMPVSAQAISTVLATVDPAHQEDYGRNLQSFLESMKPLRAKIADMRKRHVGTEVTATEPVFGYMAAALGLHMRNARFQLAVMNNTEPRASDIAAFENDLRTRKVKALIYNSQATDPAAQRLLRIAKDSRVPVVGVTETEPAGKAYQSWMLDQLNALDAALSHPAS
jgi:zinc/manganese transport system substrate-binding protein